MGGRVDDVMNIPRIINANFETLAYLTDTTVCTTNEEVNGEFSLSLVTTVDDLKTKYLYDPNNYILANNDYFKPLRIIDIHLSNGSLTVDVYAEHISYELLDKKFDSFIATNKTARETIEAAIIDTGFTLAGIEVSSKGSIHYSSETNAKQVTMGVATTWGAELQYFRKTLYLHKRRGEIRGVEFRFGKNIEGIQRTIDRADNTVAYTIDVIELKQLPEYDELERFEIGDTVKVIDGVLGLSEELRVLQRTFDVLRNISVSIQLGHISTGVSQVVSKAGGGTGGGGGVGDRLTSLDYYTDGFMVNGKYKFKWVQDGLLSLLDDKLIPIVDNNVPIESEEVVE